MRIIVDTGFLYATVDRGDIHHKRALSAIIELDNDELILPTLTLAELTYLLATRLGHDAMRRFVGSLATSNLRIESMQKDDIARIHELLNQYGDSRLDFVDAFIVALAERLEVTRILTVDHRHFRIIRPNHCEYFELRP